MTNFDADTLRALRDVQEVFIRTEKHPRSAIVIWVVVADDEVFVRSWLGPRGRWYKDLAAGGPATLELAGRQLAVQAIPAGDAASVDRTSREFLQEISAEAAMRRRWCAPKSCRPRCGSNRADPHRGLQQQAADTDYPNNQEK